MYGTFSLCSELNSDSSSAFTSILNFCFALTCHLSSLPYLRLHILSFSSNHNQNPYFSNLMYSNFRDVKYIGNAEKGALMFTIYNTQQTIRDPNFTGRCKLELLVVGGCPSI
jgi:hypothetical protein